jgi:hypothetical protein
MVMVKKMKKTAVGLKAQTAEHEPKGKIVVKYKVFTFRRFFSSLDMSIAKRTFEAILFFAALAAEAILAATVEFGVNDKKSAMRKN